MKKSTSLFGGDSLIVHLLAAQFVQEGSVGEETILILSSCQFVQKLGTIVLGDFITYSNGIKGYFHKLHKSVVRNFKGVQK